MARKLNYYELEQVINVLEKDLLEYKNARTAAFKSQEELERILNAVPDFIAAIDNQYKILRVNKSLADKLECTQERLRGEPCYQYICKADHPPSSCPHAQMLSDSKVHISENYNEQLGMNMLVTSSPLHDDKGRLIGGVITARDKEQPRRKQRGIKKKF